MYSVSSWTGRIQPNTSGTHQRERSALEGCYLRFLCRDAAIYGPLMRSWVTLRTFDTTLLGSRSELAIEASLAGGEMPQMVVPGTILVHAIRFLKLGGRLAMVLPAEVCTPSITAV